MSKYEVNKFYGEWTWHGGGGIVPTSTALVMVSMQNLHCDPESSERQAIAKAYGQNLDAWAEP